MSELSQATPIRILIADDDQVAREGLRAALDLVAGVMVVGEAGTGEAALQKVSELSPDIVFMDMRLPHMGGIEATKAIRRRTPATHVILFAADESRISMSEVVPAGVSGYLLKGDSAEELVRAARVALGDGIVLHPRLARTFIEEAELAAKLADAPPLSRQETEILRRFRDGAAIKEIARDVGLSRRTVRSIVNRIYKPRRRQW
jgi:DNA-binding NarL/FixJ family response regulator